MSVEAHANQKLLTYFGTGTKFCADLNLHALNLRNKIDIFAWT